MPSHQTPRAAGERAGAWRHALPQAVRGYCMGAADIVPGVSGGTVALVFGIYERLVHNIRTGAAALGRLLRIDLRGFRARLRDVEWVWLLTLLAGIGCAILSLVRVIRWALDEHPVETTSVFFGLVAASIVVAWRIVKRPAAVHGVVIAVVGVAFFAFLGLRGDSVDDPALWTVGAAGAVAICAMILPGISGSFILLMLGLYDYVIDAVDERDLAVVAVFGIGAVVGLASFSSLLDWLLRRYHDIVVAVLIGLMLGSLRVLWPWPEDTPGEEANAALGAPPSGEWLVPLLLAAAAVVLVLVVSAVALRTGGDPPEAPAAGAPRRSPTPTAGGREA